MSTQGTGIGRSGAGRSTVASVTPQTSVLPDTYRRQPGPGGRPAVADVLPRLRVWHRLEGTVANSAATTSDALCIVTCQREVRVRLADESDPGQGASDGSALQGAAAYRLLLEFGAGLKSLIPGETNVFGQIRAAWRSFEEQQPRGRLRELAPLIDALFRDIRDIRTRFLQGIGGQSYATLTRRLLAPRADARVLVLGFGELGRSMPAKFTQNALGIFNRSVVQPDPPGVSAVFTTGEEQAAADWASHVIVCLPRDAELDARWVAVLRDRALRGSLTTVHLGCRRAQRGLWDALPNLFDLDDLFDLQRAQEERRTDQLRRAREACHALAERAVSSTLL